uniref:Attacin C-terminal domain-containing protein n=1 Tax=Clastoptera arizonana TaxID=38151 RepID=A0A1B6D4E7_9HEMI
MQTTIVLLCLSALVVISAAAPSDYFVRTPRQAQGNNNNNNGGYRGSNGGTWRVGVDREHHGGTRVQVDAGKDLFTSRNGNMRGQVYGQYERTYGGPNNGMRGGQVGLRIQGRF